MRNRLGEMDNETIRTSSGRRDQMAGETADDDLIGAIATGDEQALRQFYERNAPWLAARCSWDASWMPGSAGSWR